MYYRTTRVVVLLLLVLTSGVLGYTIIEGMEFADAVYMTSITVSTVGFGEVQDLSRKGQWFTVFFVMLSIGTVAYAFSSIGSFLLDGEFNRMLRRKRMDKRVASLKDHIILCGYGETGQTVAKEFLLKKTPFVVIDLDEVRLQEPSSIGAPLLQGDATNEETLKRAQIENAKGLVACLPTDAENVFAVLTAREMNPNLYIVARAVDGNAHGRLRKAGANNTIAPKKLGGKRIAALITKPTVVSFIKIVNRVGGINFDIEEVAIPPQSRLIGKSLKDTRIRELTGCIVLALQRDGESIINPQFQKRVRERDTLVVLGETERIAELRLF